MRESRGNAARNHRSARRRWIRSRLPTVILVDTGTSGAAQNSSLPRFSGTSAELIGEHTIGRAGHTETGQAARRLGLWLTTTRYLCPTATRSTKGRSNRRLPWTSPMSSSASAAPSGDPALDKALERVKTQEAA